ncbi:MAG: TRAM domain-containing protein, partial [Clostridia bacterium]|nr:TRAM domain-containing protein [Clostridia bacterium]
MKEQFELLIDDISTAGEGIGHKDGRAVFVPGVLPGDRILAEMAEGKGNLLKAECIELLEPSVSRVPDDCPNGKDCGGCSLREYKYEAQLDWKKAYVNSVLTRIASLENPKI